MALTTLGIVFVVATTLGVRFKVLILFPAIGLAVVGTAVVGIAHGDSVGAVMLITALVAAALQVGYLFGVVTRAVIASLSVQQKRLSAEFMTTAELGWGQSQAFDRATRLREIQTIGQELRATYEL